MGKLPKPPKPDKCKDGIYSEECLRKQRGKEAMCQECQFLIKK